MSGGLAWSAVRAAPRGWSLSTKITLGFLVVLLLHVAVAVMGHIGQDRAQRDLLRLDEGRRLTGTTLAIDRKVGELQRHVQGYTFSGNRGLELRSEQVYEELLAALREVTAAQTAPAAGSETSLAAMAASLERYHEQFRSAVVDRERRERLVEVDLAALSTRGLQLFDRALDDAAVGGEPDLPLREARHDFLLALTGAHRYLAHLDSSAMGGAHEALQRVRAVLPAPAAPADPVQQLTPLLDGFQRVLLGLVQSTRGYLHLVHVVMAAEAVEFLRESAAWREREQTRLDALQHDIAGRQSRYQWWSNAISLLTIVLGLLAGVTVGRQVVQPLTAITSTLRRLARGEAAEVPELHRSDEIGAMAKAAEVLRERNLEAERLLAEMASLSRQREQMIHDLERSNAELDSFVHIASHDLKAPLRAMANAVRWIEQDCGAELPDRGRQHLQLLQGRIARMNRLLGDLQGYSRLTRNHCATASFAVGVAVRDAIETIDGDGCHFEVRGDDCWLETARVPFVQVLCNLIGNAVRHHDRARAAVVCQVLGVPGGVQVTITDDGPGIPAAYHQLVFEPFRTLRSRDEHDSSGVGLAIVKKLVERYAATLALHSPVADGRGTRFVLVWPHAGQRSARGREPGAVAAPASRCRASHDPEVVSGSPSR